MTSACSLTVAVHKGTGGHEQRVAHVGANQLACIWLDAAAHVGKHMRTHTPARAFLE